MFRKRIKTWTNGRNGRKTNTNDEKLVNHRRWNYSPTAPKRVATVVWNSGGKALSDRAHSIPTAVWLLFDSLLQIAAWQKGRKHSKKKKHAKHAFVHPQNNSCQWGGNGCGLNFAFPSRFWIPPHCPPGQRLRENWMFVLVYVCRRGTSFAFQWYGVECSENKGKLFPQGGGFMRF